MSSITEVRSCDTRSYEAPPQHIQENKNSKISMLPQEMLQGIFLHLDWSSFLLTRLVSRKWRDLSQLALPLFVNETKLSVIKRTAVPQVNQNLQGVFDEYLISKKEELVFANVRTWRRHWKRDWIVALQTLPSETLTQLKESLLPRPLGFRDMLERVDLYNSLLTKANEDHSIINSLLSTLLRGNEDFPSASDDPEGALELLKLLSDLVYSKHLILEEVAKSFSFNGNFKGALDATLLIQGHEWVKSISLLRIAENQLNQGDTEGALSTTQHMDEATRMIFLRSFWENIEKNALAATEEGKLEEALEMANLVGEEYRGGTLSKISQILQNKDDSEGALKIKALIPSGKTLFL